MYHSNRPRRLRTFTSIKLSKCKFSSSLNFNENNLILLIFYSIRLTVFCYAIPYRVAHHSIMCCQNGIQKFGIFHQAFLSYLLVSITKNHFLVDRRRNLIPISHLILCRYKKWSTHFKFREICHTIRRKETETKDQSLCIGWVFSEKETKSRRCFPWSGTCCSQETTC